MVRFVKEMTAKNFCEADAYESFDHLLLLFVYLFVFSYYLIVIQER